MAYKLEVDHPEFPEGTEFDCDGILVENGKSVTLTADDELAFIARWGKTVKEIYGHAPDHIKLTGSTEINTKAEKEEAAAKADAATITTGGDK
jgi:hypothetical protein